jgi:Tfp pilus assembly protein PilX
VNPIFLNAAQHDYRLATNSPAHAGFAGRDIGALYPVGAPMALSHPRFEAVTRNGTNVTLNFWADSEKTYSIQYSDAVSGGTWQALTNLTTRPLPEYMSLKDSVSEAGARFYRIVTP